MQQNDYDRSTQNEQRIRSDVVVAVCTVYDEETVFTILKEAISALGGLERFVCRNERILVKPNFLTPADRDKCITTDPAIIRAFLRLLQESGYGQVKIGDSPANGTSKQAFSKLNLDEEQLYGAEIAEMAKEVHQDFPEGRTAKSFWFTEDVINADAIIGLSKMKTHALTRITGAVKNMYGLICGSRKALGHVSYPNALVFSGMLTDIHRCTRPRLHIMDAITAMEGNGPGAGVPTDMGLILVSDDPVAIDTVFAKLVYLDPLLVPTCTQGMAAGIGTCRESDIRLKLLENGTQCIIGFDELIKRFGKPGFDVQREKDKFSMLGLLSKFTGLFGKKPYIDSMKCVKCGVCCDHCPVNAVTLRNGKESPPVYDYKKCIRCFCCQEICPRQAINVK